MSAKVLWESFASSDRTWNIKFYEFRIMTRNYDINFASSAAVLLLCVYCSSCWVACLCLFVCIVLFLEAPNIVAPN